MLLTFQSWRQQVRKKCINQTQIIPNVSFLFKYIQHKCPHNHCHSKHFLLCTVNGLVRLSCHSVFRGLKCAWILLSDAAVLGGLSGPGVIISQVSYWAADSLTGYGCFFPPRSFIGLLVFLFFLLLYLILISPSPLGSSRHSFFPPLHLN